jgi:hypothetical protein
MRPRRHRSKEQHQQDHDQDYSQHVCFLILGSRCNCSSLPTLLDGSYRSCVAPPRGSEQSLHHDADGDVNAGIVGIVQVILTADIVHINFVGVIPIARPRLDESKPISAILKARIPVNHSGTADPELMRAAEIGMETRVWNLAVADCAEAERRFRTLPGLCLLGTLGRS